jgi:Alpha-glutamyl/putrescinyl thymine pyrophosphorylase clade 3
MGRNATAMTRALLRARFTDALHDYEQANGALPGIAQPECRAALVEQLVASARRTQYFEHLLKRPGGPSVSDPSSVAFNPVSAAILQERAGNRDEAFWLVFLFVHFGKNRRSGWRLIADVYGRLGGGTLWSWEAVTADVNALRNWLDENVGVIQSLEPRRGFGNHRKYESLDAWNDSGTGAVIASYVEWVGASGHDPRIAQITSNATNPAQRFHALYQSVRDVRRFGRTGAFDYCSTLSKLGFVSIEPSAACLAGATGPLRGARLLLSQSDERLSPAALEAMLTPLRAELNVGFDDLEDALCNWQKRPDEFKPFRG